MVRRIFALHTSTHKPDESSSAALTKAALERFKAYFPAVEIRWTDGAQLNIAKNLSCYANGKLHCADPKAGPYRCWAHETSKGTDQMPVIYDNLEWCDTFIFSTSTRWGTHSAVAQNIIERMNTLENRGSSYKEPYPMRGKRLGVVASGLHYKTYDTARNLVDTLKWWGFAINDNAMLAWQRTNDPFFEQPDNNLPYEQRWLLTPRGQQAVERFVSGVTHARRIVV